MEKILIVENDESIKNELTSFLTINGYEIVSDLPCDLALLDINLDGKSGFQICAEIRKQSSVPIIFLTARDTFEDELLAFGVGGDDFIKKPYNLSVLLARIERLLKRKNVQTLTKNGLTLSLEDMTVCYGDNTELLTKNEMRILAVLIKNNICSKEQIIEYLWQNSLYIDENTLYVNINRLREKLKKIGLENGVITVRGVGYKLSK